MTAVAFQFHFVSPATPHHRDWRQEVQSQRVKDQGVVILNSQGAKGRAYCVLEYWIYRVPESLVPAPPRCFCRV
jgi:hypothetical protein